MNTLQSGHFRKLHTLLSSQIQKAKLAETLLEDEARSGGPQEEKMEADKQDTKRRRLNCGSVVSSTSAHVDEPEGMLCCSFAGVSCMSLCLCSTLYVSIYWACVIQ
jgi:hypothetical protein